jgi:hypothetical protein
MASSITSSPFAPSAPSQETRLPATECAGAARNLHHQRLFDDRSHFRGGHFIHVPNLLRFTATYSLLYVPIVTVEDVPSPILFFTSLGSNDSAFGTIMRNCNIPAKELSRYPGVQRSRTITAGQIYANSDFGDSQHGYALIRDSAAEINDLRVKSSPRPRRITRESAAANVVDRVAHASMRCSMLGGKHPSSCRRSATKSLRSS